MVGAKIASVKFASDALFTSKWPRPRASCDWNLLSLVQSYACGGLMTFSKQRLYNLFNLTVLSTRTKDCCCFSLVPRSTCFSFRLFILSVHDRCCHCYRLSGDKKCQTIWLDSPTWRKWWIKLFWRHLCSLFCVLCSVFSPQGYRVAGDKAVNV